MKTRGGFTLIELLMVLVVLSILASLAVSHFVDFGTDARKATTLDRMNQIRTAILGDPRLVSAGQYTKAGYLSHCLALPSTLDDLVTIPLTGACSVEYNPYTRQGWKGPYVTETDDWQSDAWGVALDYDSGARVIKSCGPDQVCGNDDDISISF